MHFDMPTAQLDMRAQPTHHCLFIPEVLALICEACIDPPDVESVAARNRGLRWLARLARTCKTIYAVAIRCIWKTVTEIAILAEYTMPGCWEIIRDHPDADEGGLNSVIVSTEALMPSCLPESARLYVTVPLCSCQRGQYEKRTSSASASMPRSSRRCPLGDATGQDSSLTTA